MEPIFTLPYTEHIAIEELQKKLTKAKGYSFFIPVSRQQKGVDFLCVKGKKALKFQVKSSKAYVNASKQEFSHHLWLNNFVKKYDQGNADWYAIVGLYATISAKSTKKLKNPRSWRSIIICLRERELYRLVDKRSPFIDIAFDVDEKGRIVKVEGERGFIRRGCNLTKSLLSKRASKIK